MNPFGKIGKLSYNRCFFYQIVQSVFSTLSQGLEDDIFESFLGWWADTAATYCPGRPSQIVLKSITKHRDRVEKTHCTWPYMYAVISEEKTELYGSAIVAKRSQEARTNRSFFCDFPVPCSRQTRCKRAARNCSFRIRRTCCCRSLCLSYPPARGYPVGNLKFCKLCIQYVLDIVTMYP